MIKRHFSIFVSAFLAMAFAFSCTPAPAPESEEEQNQNKEEQKDDKSQEGNSQPKYLSAKVPVPENNFIFDSKPQFTIQIINNNDVPLTSDFSVSVSSDMKVSVTKIEFPDVEVPANSTMEKTVTLDYVFDPGFYKANCVLQKRIVKSIDFGVRPTDIESAPDMQADFNSFWNDAIKQLEEVQMNPKLTLLPGKTNVYLVEMNSIPDNTTGEEVLVHAYLALPQDASATKKYPVLIHFYGYDDQKPGKMSGPSGATDFIELYMSSRGQMINNRTANLRSDGIEEDYFNIYGDWFAYNFGQKDSYYYRGAYMDCVQAVRFIETREEADLNNIFAEGNSQGGAFSYACAALSPRPLAGIAPGVAFMGDFPDYFKIAGWPASTAKANKGSMTDSEMYAFLSYFDTKNLATRVSCPIFATVGMKDQTCPPHTNMAPYNNALTPASDKEIHYYAEMAHEIAKNWNSMIKKFFKAHMK